MEMLNIPPAQPQATPPADTNGNTCKEGNPLFKEALDQAGHEQVKGLQEEPPAAEEKAAEAATAEQDNFSQGTDPLFAALQADGSKAPPAIPVEPGETANPDVTAEPLLRKEQVAVETKLSANGLAENSTSTGKQPIQHGAEPLATSATSDLAPVGVAEEAADNNVALTAPAADMTKTAKAATAPQQKPETPQGSSTTPDLAPAVGLRQGNPVAESHRQSLPQPLATAPGMQPAVPQGLQDKPLQADDGSKTSSLMENSLGSLLNGARPLRGELPGQTVADSNRNPALSLAAAGAETPVAITEAQNGGAQGSFSFEQEPDALLDGLGEKAFPSTPATEGPSFEAAMKSGLHAALAGKEGAQPLTTEAAATGTIRLGSGEVLSESQIVNQVLERIQVEGTGEQNRIVIRMHPEELGEVKLALTMEKDQLRAQLLTQNHQVQEVLEKHLPRLHEALGHQGVRLENIQVSVDSNANPGREFFDQQRQSGLFRELFDSPTGIIADEPVIAANMAAQNSSAQGLSLRV